MALDGLVGRQQDLSRLRALMRNHRLVTLVGPGGVGKTRLARELGARLVELDSVVDPSLLLPAVAGAFGVDEHAGRLVDAIGDRQTLLVLDNCEHLAEPCALLLDDLLRRCPGLRVVATSRETLRVTGEVVYRVGSLEVPSSDGRAEILRCASVRLFLERAHSADPGAEVSDADARVVAEICRRLDGLPLAIELAARRVGALSFQQIRDGLHASLLSDGPRTAPARHRSLSAAIEWSHRLLSGDELAVFRRLAVLAGGFSLEGAAAVCGLPDSVVRRMVCNLEAKSLVVRTGERFRQLNLIREFAHARLAESGELELVQDRAADWLVSVGGPVCGTLVLGEELGRSLGHEQSNLVAAVAFTAVREDERHVALAIGLVRCWYRQGRLSAARQLVSDVLVRVPSSASRGDLLSLGAVLACLQGDHVAGLPLAQEAVRAARGSGCPEGLVNALDAHALALLRCGDHAGAVFEYRECLALVLGLDRPVDVAITRNRLAWALVQSGDASGASVVLADAVAVLRADATPQHHAASLHTLGAIRLGAGEWAAAEEAFVASLRACPPLSAFLIYPVEGLVATASATGHPRRALRLATAVALIRSRHQRAAEPYWHSVVSAAAARASAQLSDSAVAAVTASGQRLGDSLVSYALRSAAEGPLTAREFEIACLVAAGSTNREIASKLALSVGTVGAHLNSIRDKLGLRSRTRIALWVNDRVS